MLKSFSPWPSFTQEEAGAVSAVLLSNKVNAWTGEKCRAFEREFAVWTDSKYAVAVSNGTTALELALSVLGIGPGDEVIVTPRTFIASVSCIVKVGATPVFADVNIDSQNITVETIQEVISPSTKAIICVHLAGWPCEMDKIMKLTSAQGFYVIEDCAQAHGANYYGRPMGSIGHMGVWSFCQDKIMSTGGEGGMVTTNDKNLWSKAWSYKDHGKSWDAVHSEEHSPGFRWLHRSFGTNFRLTEMQAAIGSIQIKRMPQWHLLRKNNAERIITTALTCPALRVPLIPSHVEHAWYKCYLFVKPNLLREGWGRDQILQEINARGIPCYTGICPEVYLEKAFERTKWRPNRRLPIAKKLGETSLMFLVHPTLTEDEITKTCLVIQSVMKEATL